MVVVNTLKGTKNAFRGLDETWGARLEASLEFDDVVYARGEAARAYKRDLQLRQFTREVLFLAGDAIVILDSVSADIPHRYEWLLQTDEPPAAETARRFTINNGTTSCQLHALQPADITHHILEQVIKANPTSAKPDWIISNTQYALALSPSESRENCAFFVILDLAEFTVESTSAERGLAASLIGEGLQWQIGFATGRDGILTENLNIDGRWFAGRHTNGQFDQLLAGDVTSIWLDGELHFVADRPVDVALKRWAEGMKVSVTAADTTWVRFKSSKPSSDSRNGQNGEVHYDAPTGMVWVQVQAGKTEIAIA